MLDGQQFLRILYTVSINFQFISDFF